MALTTEQALLLNNLMYLEPGENSPLQRPDSFEGQTVGDWLNSIDTSRIQDAGDYGSFTTGADWKNIIEAARQDSTLMNMRIADTHVDASGNGGGGRSAVFISEETGDAFVVFKGTESSKEWVDNFQGGNTTDTAHQQNALEWYREVYGEHNLGNYEVTVSGHSKGGNKAKYITVLDDSVDHCLAFDGQGFSDQFMEKYAGEISARQEKIENHNVDYDYVNFLLNDIGNSTYYEGHDYGAGGFLENHCPNTFLNFHEDGSFSLSVNPDGQAEEIQALDAFLNNLLRSMPDGRRDEMLTMVNAVLNTAFSFDGTQSSQDVINTFLDMAADPEYSDALAYLIAYTVEYEQANPELAEQINSILQEFGMDDFTRYVDVTDGLLNFEKEFDLGLLGTYRVDFDLLYDLANGVTTILPGWIWDKILAWLREEYGIDLTREELTHLLNVVGKVNENMDHIKIEDNGADIQIASSGSGSGGPFASISIHVSTVRQEAGTLRESARGLQQYAEMLRTEAGNISFQTWSAEIIRQKLQRISDRIGVDGEKAKGLGDALTEAAQRYEHSETQNLSRFG